MQFTDQILSYIEDKQLCPPNAKILVGVSGGADSVALLHCMRQLGYQCIVAHCNFHLRGQESDKDELFVKSLAEEWNLPFYSISFATKKIAAEEGISIEMAARNLRYKWFADLHTIHNTLAIAVAHHLDDAIETFFINLARGTGIRGLLGIPPKNGNVIRPFLTVSRKNIHLYLEENHLTYRTDQSNFDQSIIRNKIRHTIIPAFESINASFGNTMKENFDRLAEVNDIVTQHIDDLKKQAIKDHSHYLSIEISELKNRKNLFFSLYELLKPYHFNASVVRDIVVNLGGLSGIQFYSPTHRIIKDRDFLLVEPLTQKNNKTYRVDFSDKIVLSPIRLRFSEPVEVDLSLITPKKTRLYCDVDKLTFPLEIRHPQPGDFFCPFGTNHRKKLSDFFIDEKWNRIDKENCWVLLSNEQIVWIIGHRSDNRFRIGNNSKKMLIVDFFSEVV